MGSLSFDKQTRGIPCVLITPLTAKTGEPFDRQLLQSSQKNTVDVLWTSTIIIVK